jgi:hypothetical protein
MQHQTSLSKEDTELLWREKGLRLIEEPESQLHMALFGLGVGQAEQNPATVDALDALGQRCP